MTRFTFKQLIILAALTTLMFNNCTAVPKQEEGNDDLEKKDEPWLAHQLMQPSDLVSILNEGNDNIYIFNIGPSGSIKNSIKIGPGEDEDSIEKLKAEASQLDKDANIVIYCGCCPFDKCPNIRPAFILLNEMKFANHKLLNLTQNLKVNWIDEGYPIN